MAIQEARSPLSPKREAAPSLSFARNRHGSHKLPCRFEAGRNDRPLPVQQGRAALTLIQGTREQENEGGPLGPPSRSSSRFFLLEQGVSVFLAALVVVERGALLRDLDGRLRDL